MTIDTSTQVGALMTSPEAPARAPAKSTASGSPSRMQTRAEVSTTTDQSGSPLSPYPSISSSLRRSRMGKAAARREISMMSRAVTRARGGAARPRTSSSNEMTSLSTERWRQAALSRGRDPHPSSNRGCFGSCSRCASARLQASTVAGDALVGLRLVIPEAVSRAAAMPCKPWSCVE